MEQTKDGFSTGAIEDIGRHGWFVGHFMESPDWARSNDVEIKFGNHPKGEKKPAFGMNKTAQTVTVLVKGKMKYFWREDGVERMMIIEGEGQYYYCPPGMPHRWEALEHVIAVTVRWPSVPGDQVTVD